MHSPKPVVVEYGTSTSKFIVSLKHSPYQQDAVDTRKEVNKLAHINTGPADRYDKAN